ncbi:MAG: 1-deoxy-D-xylulose-5-phosphate reductoisomerase [Nitrospiraceae bacterium]|nr:1-deoxy-D-xylulose-5-phosphate reductoisomerase [Nitrospiraceae bacterium]
MPTRISILGSTGSIGRNAAEVVRSDEGRFDVAALAAHSNIGLLAEQIAEFKPEFVAVADLDAGACLAAMDLGVPVACGPEALEEAAAMPVDIALCGMVGAAGLRPLMAAIDAGNRIALANKESLVMAGEIVMAHARARGIEIIPVDSEHNAIFQCLEGHRLDDVACVHLTASGGPFYGRARDTLSAVTPEEATCHPTWDMGAKISVDSATLMNKGLEVIEAMWLFGLPLSKIQVVIHPQSIVHSLVEFTDGSILAHLGVTDMRFPIQFALTWPERVQSPMERLDLTQMRALTFGAPEFEEFPCLAHALRAAEAGGAMPAVLNAANEEAVAAFCAHRIGFLEIEEVVRRILDAPPSVAGPDLAAIEAVDVAARRQANDIIQSLSDN